jgi:hypothetical protein
VTSTLPHSAQLSNAEILLWQGKFRRAFAALVALIALSLKWSGLIDAQSVLVPALGVNGALGVATAAVVLYLVFNEVVLATLRRTGSASRGLLFSVLGADYFVIFTVMLASTPPREYARGLILAIFVVHLTRLYFGYRATMMSLAAAATGFGGLVVISTRLGALERPEEQFWNLAIFLLGALLLGGLHGQVSGRLTRVMQLFDRAQEGDFSGTYDESLDRMPDSWTA